MTTSNNNDPNAVVAADAAASLTLTTSMLHAADGSRSVPTSDIVYTVAISPLKGSLAVNGTTLGLNGQFTQAQIDQGLVVYTNDGSTGFDSLDFSIKDAAFGDELGTATVVVSQVNSHMFVDGQSFSGGTDPVIFFSESGNYSFTGGTDTTVSYALAGRSIGVNLALGSVSNGSDGSDTLANVHSVIGSSYSDSFYAGPGQNFFTGGGGNDTITGDPNVADASDTTVGFSGARSDYLIIGENPVHVKIIDLRPGSPDGADDVTWAQSFHFSDGTYTFAQLNAIEEIDESGATDVAVIGNNYFLYAHDTETGPELKYQGSPVTSGQFAHWFPLSAEPVASGYQVVWHNNLDDTYMAWTVDSNGNYVSTPVQAITEVDPAYAALEITAQQDFNFDQVVGAPRVTPVESFGSTSLTKVGEHYYLFANGSSNGPELKDGFIPVMDNTFVTTIIGAEQTASGYEVAWHNSNGTYTVWSVDSNGNRTSSDLVSNVSASNVGLQSLEPSFHQDLNGDGVIGIVIESAGSTSLIKSGGDYFLGTSGPTLKYAGAVVTDSTFPGLTPIGTEATATGFEVALHDTAANQYDIWLTDSNGNINAIVANNLPGNSLQLESLETTFQQDLNGDGVTGLPATVIESAGSTSLLTAGGDYFLGTSGPTLKYAGAVVTDSTFPGLTPIGTEATATGFEVVLHDTAAGKYDIWLTDSNGNINSIVGNNLPGTSSQLESLEATFHQDLNGDSVIGNPTTVIESAGSTSLIKSGGDYFLGTSGPTLKYAGAVVTDSTFPGLTPIGTEATANGFEIVLHDTAANQYDIWLTDSGGNINSIVGNNLPGNSAVLESLEPGFQQDLNGDGVIGPASHTSPAAAVVAPITAPASGNANLSGTAASDSFVFNANFGNDTVGGFRPGADHVDIDHSLFASVADIAAHTADNAGSGATSTTGGDHPVIFDSVSKLLLQHASDFHLV